MYGSLLRIVCLVVLLVPLQSGAQEGRGAIILSSTLLNVAADARTSTLRVSNGSSKAQRYRVALVDLLMGADGQLSAIDEGDRIPDHLASPWLVATPRSLALEPGESQTVRLLIRRPAGLEPGEYRTHLRVSQEPPQSSAGGLEGGASDEALQFQITTVYSVSVPIVIEHGASEVSARLTGAMMDGAQHLRMTIERQGNASFRGFARASDGASFEDFPITVYRERQTIDLVYPLGAFVDPDAPLTLTLYEGAVPREGEPVPSRQLGTLQVAR